MNWSQLFTSGSASSRAAVTGLPSPTTTPKGAVLGIDWSETSLTVLQFAGPDAAAGAVQRLELTFPPELRLPVHAGQVGVWIQAELRRHGVPIRPAVVCVPRKRSIITLTEAPRAAADHVVGAVRHQAEHRLGAEAGPCDIDLNLFPMAAASDSTLQPVLAAMLPMELSRLIETVLTAAQIPIHALGLGELALPQLDRRSDGFRLDILCGAKRSELVLSWSGQAVASRSVMGEIAEGNVRCWLATADRMMESLPESLTRDRLVEVVVHGPEASDAALLLSELSTIPSRIGVAAPEIDVRLRAYLASTTCPEALLDFAHPRRTADPNLEQSRRKRLSILAASVILCPAAAWFLRESRDLDQQLVQLKQRERELQQLVERGQPSLIAEAFLEDWRQNRTDWAITLNDLLPRLPSGGKGYLSRLQLEHSDGGAASVQASGFARSPEEVVKLNRSLLTQSDRYELQPRAIEPNPLDAEFKARFQTDITLKPIDVEEAESSEEGDAT
jgi:Tfp pilus assembly protein PilN